MANPKKRSQTQTLDAYVPPDRRPPGGGARGGDDLRGLAAFDKGQDPAPSRPQKGSSRWSGGGASSAPPPRPADTGRSAREGEDEDLRRERLEAHYHDDDDEMVAVSATDWSDVVPAAAPRGKGRKVVPEPEEDEEVEETPRRRSSAWKWILGILLLGGAGAGAAIGIGALKKDSPEPAPLADSRPDDQAKRAAAEPEPEPEPDPEPEPVEPEPAVAVAEPAAAVAEPAAPTAAEPSAPAAWAPAAIAKNPAVDIPAAPSGQRLGLRDEEIGGPLDALRTGLRPAARSMAPTRPYRLQSHEVSWGEIALATTIPELATAPRPAWVPKSASRAAPLPATGLPWGLARAYCQALGGDLPSEAEWEWAARGAEDRYFPWGREAIDAGKARILAQSGVPFVPVATSKLDQTPGPTPLFEMLGNAQEWTRDAWSPSDPASPDPRSATHKAVRGWPLIDPGQSAPAEGTTYRAAACADPSCLAAEARSLSRVGFRCVLP